MFYCDALPEDKGIDSGKTYSLKSGDSLANCNDTLTSFAKSRLSTWKNSLSQIPYFAKAKYLKVTIAPQYSQDVTQEDRRGTSEMQPPTAVTAMRAAQAWQEADGHLLQESKITNFGDKKSLIPVCGATLKLLALDQS